MTGRRSLCFAIGALALLSLGACREKRPEARRAPTYADVSAILSAACLDCHEGQEASGGWRAESYLQVIGCTDQGRVVTQPASEEAPLVQVLEREDHAGLLDDAQRELLLRWVQAGAPKFRGTVHDVGIVDPRDDQGWHGNLAAQDDWGPLTDPDHPLNCGRCHEGSPTRPADVRSGAPEATACVDCHDEPAGVLGCATCHGDGPRAYPPRDACYFESSPQAGAHAAHLDLESLAVRAQPVPCGTCHPIPQEDAVLAGAHADGSLDVRLEGPLVDAQAQYDSQSGACAVQCHARGGERAEVRWQAVEESLDCDSCHLSPPREHYPGACDGCHAEMGESPSSLQPGPLHINGQVDAGDGSGQCDACHGRGNDGWPADESHARHRLTELAEPVLCAECHPVPATLRSEGHLDGMVQLSFGGRALREGLQPRFEEDGCQQVACHAAWLREPARAPAWGDARPPRCQNCHGAPPDSPHTADSGCSALLCHGSMVAETRGEPEITPGGTSLHLDGQLNVGAP